MLKNNYLLKIKDGKLIILDHENTPYLIIFLMVIIFIAYKSYISFSIASTIFIITLFIIQLKTKIIIDPKNNSLKKAYFFINKEIYTYFTFNDLNKIKILCEEANAPGGDTGVGPIVYCFYLQEAKSKDKIFLLQLSSIKDVNILSSTIKKVVPTFFQCKY